MNYNYNEPAIEELILFTKGETIRRFRKNAKKMYKWYLCGLLKEILIRGKYIDTFYYGELKMMFTLSDKFPEPDNRQLSLILSKVKIELKSNFFINAFSDKSVDKYITFFRNFLKGMKEKQKSLYMVSEFDEVFDVKKYYLYTQDIILKEHHWVEINFLQAIIHTIPEFFNYMDLLILWNDFIFKTEKYNEEINKRKSLQNDITRYFYSSEARELRIAFSTYPRLLINASVTFVESYLYYYFYNIKNNKDKNTDENIIGILNRDGYIQDTQIVEDIIFKIHPEIKGNLILFNLYKSYKKVVSLRDRYIHTSAFIDSSNQITQIQPLLNLGFDELIEKLQICVDLVKALDYHLPNDEKVIQWWRKFEDPVFSLKKKISVLNIFNPL